MNKTYETYSVNLTREEAEKLNWTLLKHSTAVVMENIQKQILKILDNKKKEEENMKK